MIKFFTILDYLSSYITFGIGIMVCEYFVTSTMWAFVVGILTTVLSLALEKDRRKRRGE